MYTYTIVSVTLNQHPRQDHHKWSRLDTHRVSDPFYELSSVYGTPTNSNSIYFLPLEDKHVGDSLASRHGCKGITDLVGIKFSSRLDSFDDAFETLLFGSYFKVENSDDLLTKILIPAILNRKEPDLRGFDIDIAINYIKHAFASHDIKEVFNSRKLDGSAWISKVNKLIPDKDRSITLHTFNDTVNKLVIKGYHFLFTVLYNNTETLHYSSTPSKNILSITHSLPLKIYSPLLAYPKNILYVRINYYNI